LGIAERSFAMEGRDSQACFIEYGCQKKFAGADALAAQFEFWPALKIAR
jgi:hypothetical protein